jgi:hypothetical protein
MDGWVNNYLSTQPLSYYNSHPKHNKTVSETSDFLVAKTYVRQKTPRIT